MRFARCAVSLFAAAVCISAARADEPERLDPEKAKKFGGMIAEAVAKLDNLPLKMKLDGDQAMAMTAQDRGAMLIPDAGLTLDKLAKLDKEIVPVGLLAMRRVSLSVAGETVAGDKLRQIEVTAGDKTASVAVLPLAATRVDGRLVLLVYGKDKAPVMVTIFREADHANSMPLEMDVQKAGADGMALLLVGVLGKHKAALLVVAQD